MVNSRQKGASFERKIAKKFNEWCKDRWTFRRSPLSGGWDPKAQTGDIFPLELKDTWPFIIEVRKNELYTLDTVLSKDGIIYKWFAEKKKLYAGHAEEHGLKNKPIIFVMCRNNVSPVVVFDGTDADVLLPEHKYRNTFLHIPHIRVKYGEYDFLFILDLDVFLRYFSVDHIFPIESEGENGTDS